MVGFKNKRYSLFALFIIICHFLKGQNNENFLKSMIRESFKLSVPLQDEQLLKSPEKPDDQDTTKINPSLKKKLLLYSNGYYMYDGSDLNKDFDNFLKENKYSRVPEGLTKGYTNPTYDNHNQPVFFDGRWGVKGAQLGDISANSGGAGGSISDLIAYIKSKTPKEKRKRKALKIITEIVYPIKQDSLVRSK